jgi:hypothetical protein
MIPNGGVADSLDKAKAAGPGGGGGRRPSTVRPAEKPVSVRFLQKADEICSTWAFLLMTHSRRPAVTAVV